MSVWVPWADHRSCPVAKGRRMSYQSRVKKRKYKRLEAKAKRSRTAESAGRWFLTLAKRPGRYMCCDRRFDRGAEIVYRHEPREVRCLRCAERDPGSKGFRTSVRYDQAKRKAAA
jgi:hypothetical protein